MLDLPDKLVLMGMSCVGKTTLAHVLESRGYTYHSFDAQYNYKRNGLPGVSKQKQWKTILGRCTEDRWVLDNWSTEDRLGQTIFEMHPDACVVVLFDEYANILRRYRVPVRGEDAHKMMFVKMYRQMPFEEYARVRYVRVDRAEYAEMSVEEFRERASEPCSPEGMVFKDWTWQ